MSAVKKINVAGLEQHLRRHVSGEVRFDASSLAMYASDASNFRQVPIGVVVPRTLDDVVATVDACHRYRAPVLSRGGGTSLSGETVNVAVIIDFSKYLTAIGEIDVARKLVTAQPGVINDQLNRATSKHGLVFGPDPSSHSRSEATSATTRVESIPSKPISMAQVRAPRTTPKRWRYSPTTVRDSGSG
jgi:FAD/FMN-containing dehydrogenase